MLERSFAYVCWRTDGWHYELYTYSRNSALHKEENGIKEFEMHNETMQFLGLAKAIKLVGIAQRFLA